MRQGGMSEHREAEIFGSNLRRCREASGLSQSVFSRQLGIPQPTLSDVENGSANLTLRSMSKLAKAAGLSLRALLEP
jgi:transcriptional regulator with XRE-family HTH domain